MARLEAELAAIEEKMITRKATDVVLGGDEAKRLRSLGYLGGGHDAASTEEDPYSLEDVKDMIESANRMRLMSEVANRGEFGQADAMGREILEARPTLAKHVHRILGSARLLHGDNEKAIEHLSQTLRIDANDVEAHRFLGLASVRMGKHAEAADHFSKVLAIRPEDTHARAQLGRVLSAQGKIREAAEQYRQILKANPRSAAGHRELAALLDQQGQESEAAAHRRRAAELAPDDGAAELQLGMTLQKSGKLEEAVVHYRKAVELDGTNPTARIGLAGALVAIGRDPEAETVIRNGLAPDGKNAAYLSFLGKLYLNRGVWAEAASLYQRLVGAGSEEWTDYYGLGVALVRLNKEAEASAAFAKAVGLDKDGQGACQKIVVFWTTEGRYDRAVAILQAGLGTNPDDVKLGNLLARILATCPEAGVRDGKQAVRLAEGVNQKVGGQGPRILDTLAAAYAEAERFEEAVATAERALAAARQKNRKALASAIEKRLALYRQGKAYHESAKAKSK